MRLTPGNAQYSESIRHNEDVLFRIAEPVADPLQQELFEGGYPEVVYRFPQLRFMGSKYRLMPWIHKILSGLAFDTVVDAFSGSGCVAYLFKAMGKEVTANDFLNLSAPWRRHSLKTQV